MVILTTIKHYYCKARWKTINEDQKIQKSSLRSFKPIDGLNPNFMKNIFSIKLNARIRPNDILKARKSATFEDKASQYKTLKS